MTDTPRGNDKLVGLLFVAVQTVLLAALIVLPGRADWPTPAWLERSGLVCAALGLILCGLGALRLGSSLTPTPVPAARGELATTGAYAYVRHPIYSGLLVAVVGLTARSGSWLTLLTAAATVAFFHAKARWEEARLRRKYAAYDAYAARTPRFVPRLRPRSRDAGRS